MSASQTTAPRRARLGSARLGSTRLDSTRLGSARLGSTLEHARYFVEPRDGDDVRVQMPRVQGILN